MALLDLPDELQDLWVSGTDHDDLKALRLTCRALRPTASKCLFRHLILHPSDESSRKALHVLEDSKLSALVKAVSFFTTTDPWGDVDGGAFQIHSRGASPADDEDDEDETSSDLPELFKIVIQQIGRFRSLERVELIFHPDCFPGNSDELNIHELPQDFEWRNTVLRIMVDSLNNHDHPATKVHALSITNLQNQVDDSVATSDNFKAVLGRLDSLELQITTQTEGAAPEAEIEKEEAHRFFGTELKAYWLRPVAENLKHLKIFSRQMYWSYFPYCDLRDLDFPKLQSLSLGNMTFTHDWQLDWILHISTLEVLVLDDCPIVLGCHMYIDAFGSDRAPPDLDKYNANGGDCAWYYAARWHDYFRRIQQGLPRLRHFACGHGPWDFSKAFEDSASLRPQIWPQRYVCFESGIGPSQWLEGGIEQESDSWQDVWEDAPLYPDCEGRDEAALQDLLAVLKYRNCSLD